MHIHKYRIVHVEHLRTIRSKHPVTQVSKVCNCGKPKFKQFDGFFTVDQLKGKR